MPVSPMSETCPDYNAALSSPIFNFTSVSHQTRWDPPPPPPLHPPSPPPARCLPRLLQRDERYVYTYSLVASATPVQFLVSVETSSGKPTSDPGRYKFKLSLRAGSVERSLGEPVEMCLTVDPRQLSFVVFVLPGRTNLLIGGLWYLRVWLRVNSVDHRLFGEDELWIGKDIDFTSIPDASFARHILTNPKEQVYSSLLGNVRVNFIVRWQSVSHNAYEYTLDYEAGGVSSTLFDDLELKFDLDPRQVTFIIYTAPPNSLRIWVRSPIPTSLGSSLASIYEPSIHSTSYAYQRIWKTDALKIGSRLDFASLGSKVIMGLPRAAGPETMFCDESPMSPASSSSCGRTRGGSLDSGVPSFYRRAY